MLYSLLKGSYYHHNFIIIFNSLRKVGPIPTNSEMALEIATQNELTENVFTKINIYLISWRKLRKNRFVREKVFASSALRFTRSQV